MTTLEKKALDALRAIVADVDAPGHTIRNISALSVLRAREVLADAADNPDDSERALVMRHALEVYSEQQYRLARDARNTRKMRDVFASRTVRARYAQGCDARRKIADALRAELDES